MGENQGMQKTIRRWGWRFQFQTSCLNSLMSFHVPIVWAFSGLWIQNQIIFSVREVDSSPDQEHVQHLVKSELEEVSERMFWKKCFSVFWFLCVQKALLFWNLLCMLGINTQRSWLTKQVENPFSHCSTGELSFSHVYIDVLRTQAHMYCNEKWVPKHEDCLWDIAKLALDCVSSAFCDLPLAILMRSGTLTRRVNKRPRDTLRTVQIREKNTKKLAQSSNFKHRRYLGEVYNHESFGKPW